VSRLASSLVVLALAFALAACGSSDSSTEDFRAEADEICVEQVRSFQEVEERLGTSTSIEEEAKLQQELLPIREESLADLEGVEAPEESEKAWQGYLEIRRELRDLRKKQLLRLNKGDEEALQPLNQKIGDLNDELNEAGEEAGLLACASVLPEDQAKETEEVVEEVALTTDPKRVCDELVTQNYLDTGFEGSFEKCAKFQRENGDKFADKIKVEKVEGVADTSAAVTITEIGGEFDGEETTWALRREGDQWKVNLISAAS